MSRAVFVIVRSVAWLTLSHRLYISLSFLQTKYSHQLGETRRPHTRTFPLSPLCPTGT